MNPEQAMAELDERVPSGEECIDALLRPFQQAEEYPPRPQMEAMELNKDSSPQEFADKLIWGTYGRPAKHPVQWKRLRDLDTEHLQNIVATERHIPVVYSRAIMLILRERAMTLKPKSLSQRLWRLVNSV